MVVVQLRFVTKGFLGIFSLVTPVLPLGSPSEIAVWALIH